MRQLLRYFSRCKAWLKTTGSALLKENLISLVSTASTFPAISNSSSTPYRPTLLIIISAPVYRDEITEFDAPLYSRQERPSIVYWRRAKLDNRGGFAVDTLFELWYTRTPFYGGQQPETQGC